MLCAALLCASLASPLAALPAPPQDPLPLAVQAGQLLRLQAPGRPTPGHALGIAGLIRGPVLTGGEYVPFLAVEGLELDPVAGEIRLRVPPRETGPIEVRFAGPGPRTQPRRVVMVDVRPPDLFDGIRVDGIFDPFEAGLAAGHAEGGMATIPMYDARTMLLDGFIDVEYEVTTDRRHVYLRVTWDDPTEDRAFDLATGSYADHHDLLFLQMDHDADGTYEPGEDARITFTYLTGSGCLDQHAIDGTGAGGDDSTVNGIARMDYDDAAARYTAEYLLPRAADANGHDADLSSGAMVRFNLYFLDGTGLNPILPRIGALFGLTGTDSSGWGTVPLPPPLPARYAPALAPDQGTFVCVSNHEHAKGELYELDFATGELVRLTFNDRYEDWVSVAPDGSFASYGSSPEQADFTGYEIYKWERNTGLETALTLDIRLDGHPGISPDNQTIAFVTFNASGTADVYTMDRDGGNRVRITNNAIEENDPEWTKDGRLVIKSSQWTGMEQMAVMDLQGNIERRLTNNPNSDHDAYVTADNRWVLYERFEGTWPWTQDWNLTNSTPWSIRMVSLDGREHRLLVLDGIVNWLPVMAPGGAIVYFKNTAFNGGEVRLIDRFGIDHGRFLTAHSQIRYLDWK